jgi:hypothetical protein
MAEFGAVGLWYDYTIPDFKAVEISGRIGNLSCSATKEGMAGVEQDVIIKTATGEVTFEIVAWRYGYSTMEYGCGIIIFDNGQYIRGTRKKVNPRQMYPYRVSISPDGTIFGIIWDEHGSMIVEDNYPCNAQYVANPTSYLEYWREDVPGAFYFEGCERLEGLYDPNLGWKSPEECLNKNYSFDKWSGDIFHCKHYLENGHYVWEAEIVDPYAFDSLEIASIAIVSQ